MKVSHKVLETISNVAVLVPKGGMKLEKTKKIGETTIPWHWQYGMPVKPGVYLNDFFYGVQKSDFGKEITATVEVIEKTIEDGRTFLMRNIKKTEDSPKMTMKIVVGGPGFPIGYDTNKFVCFEAR